MVALASTIVSPFFAYTLHAMGEDSATPLEKGNKKAQLHPRNHEHDMAASAVDSFVDNFKAQNVYSLLH
jgi:hypothetical protein